MTILVNPARFRLGADTAVGRLLGEEPSGLAVDFITMQALVRDDSFPVTGFMGDANSLLTYTAPSSKFVCNVTGTLVSGTTLRTDHDPITHEPLGVLVEEQRTNLFLQSGAMHTGPAWADQTIGAGAPVPTANAAVSPNGTTTATRLAFPAISTAGHATIHSQSVGVTAGAHSISVWMKGVAGGETVYLGTQADGINFQRLACTLTTSWTRYTLAATLTTTGWWFSIGVDRRDPAQGAQPAQSIYVWGAQHEAGAFPTSYIPTVASQVTRAGDDITLPVANFPFNYGASTLVTDMGRVSPSANGIVSIDSGSGANLITMAYLFNTVSTFAVNASSAASASWSLIWATAAFTKSALAAALDDFMLCRDGVLQTPDTSGAMPVSLLSLRLRGMDGPGSRGSGQYVKTVTYLPRRASNSELQRMTT